MPAVRGMHPPSVRRPRVAGVVLATGAVALAVLAGCDGNDDRPGPTVTPTSGSAGPSVSTGSSVSGTPSASDSTPATSPSPTVTATGPATPAATPGRFAIAVAGAGEVSYAVSQVSCTGDTVTATATATDGGTGGVVTLDAAGGLAVSGLPPLDGTRLTGTIVRDAGTVRWTGDGTGSAASLEVTCP